MGNKQSSSGVIIKEINQVAQKLSDQYSANFLDPGFCNQIALSYNDPLLKSSKKNLDNVSHKLGLQGKSGGTKQKMCESIIKRYTDRLNLLAGIQQSLSYVPDRILAITSGPRCEGSPEIFDQSKCSTAGGDWKDYLVPPDKNVSENDQWFEDLQDMQDTYLENLEVLLNIVKQIQDYDQKIDDESLQTLKKTTKNIIHNMHKHAHNMYKILLTSPTYSSEEVELIQQQGLAKKQETAARAAALRKLNNLAD